MDRHCNKNVVSLVSSVMMVKHLPISCDSSMTLSCQVRAVSIVKGHKIRELANLVYLSIICATLRAAAVDLTAVLHI